MRKLFKILLISTLSVTTLSACSEVVNDVKSDIKTDSEDSQKSKVLEATNVQNISLSGMSDNIKIFYYDESDILVKTENINDYSYRSSDGSVDISPNKKEEYQGDVTIYLPKKEYNEIKINNTDASTKVFDVKVHTLGVYSNNQVVVDKVEATYLRVKTDDKIVLTKSTVEDVILETQNNKIIVDYLKVDKALFKTENGDIFANIQGNKDDYNITNNSEEFNEEGKVLVTKNNSGNIDIKFIN